MGEGLQRAVKAAKAARVKGPKRLKTAGHDVRKSTQSDMLATRGWLRASMAAQKIGREFGYIHRQMKDPESPLHPRQGGSMRVGYMHFVNEGALRELVGEVAGQMFGLRTRAQVAALGKPAPVAAAP